MTTAAEAILARLEAIRIDLVTNPSLTRSDLKWIIRATIQILRLALDKRRRR